MLLRSGVASWLSVVIMKRPCPLSSSTHDAEAARVHDGSAVPAAALCVGEFLGRRDAVAAALGRAGAAVGDLDCTGWTPRCRRAFTRTGEVGTDGGFGNHHAIPERAAEHASPKKFSEAIKVKGRRGGSAFTAGHPAPLDLVQPAHALVTKSSAATRQSKTVRRAFEAGGIGLRPEERTDRAGRTW